MNIYIYIYIYILKNSHGSPCCSNGYIQLGLASRTFILYSIQPLSITFDIDHHPILLPAFSLRLLSFTPLLQHIASLYTAGVFFAFIPLLWFVGWLSRRTQLSDRNIMIVAFAATALSTLLLFNYTEGNSAIYSIVMFTVGALIAAGASTVAKTITRSSIIKILPPRLNSPMMVILKRSF